MPTSEFKSSVIESLEHRIKAQQHELDALERNPDNNEFVNYIRVAKERRKETAAILEIVCSL